MRKLSLSVGALSACVALSVAACSSEPTDDGDNVDGMGGDASDSGDTLSIFSWWTAPGEAEALQGLIDTFKEANADARVVLDEDVSAQTWEEKVTEKLGNSPWDVVQMSASDLESFTGKNPGGLLAVDEIYAEDSLKDAIIPEIALAAQVDGKAYGVVTGIHRNNAFFYNQRVLDTENVDAPTTIAELLESCEALKEAGVVPLAITFQSWALRIAFDEILAGTLGAEAFAEYLALDEVPTDDQLLDKLTETVDVFDLLLTEYVDVELSKPNEYGWAEAAGTFHEGDAAFMFHGDWAKGFLVSLGSTPGIDFGVSGPPGAYDLFIYGADTFVMPATAPHPEQALEFLRVVASKEGQVAFNRLKGSTPMRSDVRDQLDEPGKVSLDNLVNAKVLTKAVWNSALDDAIQAYSQDGDRDALLDVYLTTKPAP
jgi:glucose/mannose transport system substrate-binding protein